MITVTSCWRGLMRVLMLGNISNSHWLSSRRCCLRPLIITVRSNTRRSCSVDHITPVTAMLSDCWESVAVFNQRSLSPSTVNWSVYSLSYLLDWPWSLQPDRFEHLCRLCQCIPCTHSLLTVTDSKGQLQGQSIQFNQLSLDSPILALLLPLQHYYYCQFFVKPANFPMLLQLGPDPSKVNLLKLLEHDTLPAGSHFCPQNIVSMY